MEDYKSNSHKAKDQQTSPPEKKVEKVISGSATTRKKNEVQKFADVFISEDISNVKNYILAEVLVPAIKKTISDIVTNGLDILFYGEAGRTRRGSNSASKVSYHSSYDRENDRRDRPNTVSRGFDYDNLLFDTRGDAEAVLDAMNDILGQYGVVSVADLYDLANVTNENFSLNKYGWTDIRGSKALRVRDGYVLRLPKPMPIN